MAFFIINNIKAGAGVIESDEVIAFFLCHKKRDIFYNVRCVSKAYL